MAENNQVKKAAEEQVKEVAKKKNGVGFANGASTVIGAYGALKGFKQGRKLDQLDADIREVNGLEQKKNFFDKHLGKIAVTGARIAGAAGGYALANKFAPKVLGINGLAKMAGTQLGSGFAGLAAIDMVSETNRRRVLKDLAAKEKETTKEQSNFTKNMYQTRQFNNKVIDFLGKHKNALIGAGIGATAGVAGGYMMDKKAQRKGNFIKRNAGLLAGGLAGAGAGFAAGHYGLHNKVAGLFKKKGGDQVVVPEVKQESNYLNYLASKYYSGEANTPMNTSNTEVKQAKGFWNRVKTGASNLGQVAKNNWKGAAIGAVGLGAAGAGIGRIVASRRGKNKKKAMAIGAGIGAVAGAGLGMAAQHYGLPNKVAGLFRKQ